MSRFFLTINTITFLSLMVFLCSCELEKEEKENKFYKTVNDKKVLIPGCWSMDKEPVKELKKHCKGTLLEIEDNLYFNLYHHNLSSSGQLYIMTDESGDNWLQFDHDGLSQNENCTDTSVHTMDYFDNIKYFDVGRKEFKLFSLNTFPENLLYHLKKISCGE
ncbi:MAG: hypothetical protein HQK83_03415 [Fibrobacteria bacterium]|nr:hypothetical protein [Fibrobacteria bacterium]